MKNYKVSRELKPYVRRILLRSYYSCKMEREEHGYRCYTNAPSDAFHQISQRAKCEKATHDTGIFQVTAKEANNACLLPILLDAAGTTTYQVLDDHEGRRTAF